MLILLCLCLWSEAKILRRDLEELFPTKAKYSDGRVHRRCSLSLALSLAFSISLSLYLSVCLSV